MERHGRCIHDCCTRSVQIRHTYSNLHLRIAGIFNWFECIFVRQKTKSCHLCSALNWVIPRFGRFRWLIQTEDFCLSWCRMVLESQVGLHVVMPYVAWKPGGVAIRICVVTFLQCQCCLKSLSLKSVFLNSFPLLGGWLNLCIGMWKLQQSISTGIIYPMFGHPRLCMFSLCAFATSLCSWDSWPLRLAQVLVSLPFFRRATF